MTEVKWPAGWTSHVPRNEDVDDVVAMFNARSMQFTGTAASSREHVEGWWASERVDTDRDFVIVRDSSGSVVGIAAADDRGEPYASIGCTSLVHPDHQGNAPLWDSLYSWALRRTSEIAEKAKDGVRVVASEQSLGIDEARNAALERAGFDAVRMMNRMELDLDCEPPEAEWPEGIRWRVPDPKGERDLIVDTRREIWRDHWGAIERPREDLIRSYDERIEEEGELFDPELQIFAVEGTEVVGLCICRSHISKDTSRGFIGFLGTRRPWRRRGIANALLRQALRVLYQKGRKHAELDVDSENLTGAVRLYERAGMCIIRQAVWHEKEIRAGADVVTRDLAD